MGVKIAKDFTIYKAKKTFNGGILCDIKFHDINERFDYVCIENSNEREMQEVWDFCINNVDIEPYTEEDEKERIAQVREVAELPVTEFIIKANRLGFITKEEAKIASKGDLPDSFKHAFMELEEEGYDIDEMEIIFARTEAIPRNHPILLGLQRIENIPDSLLDEMFNIDTSNAFSTG